MKQRHSLLWIFSALFLASLLQPALAADQVRPQRYTLIIHMTPAICAMDSSRRKLRQCQEGFSLTIASLKPELPSHTAEDCYSKTPAALNPLQARVVDRVMPDESLRQEDWQRNGGCTGMTASTYFRTIANYAGRLRVPPEFNAPREVTMQRSSLIQQLQLLNNSLPADGVQLRCTQPSRFSTPVLTELRVCYNASGQYVSCPATVRSNCPATFVLQGAP
ncbi:ribonuclease I [Alkanindiges sp. WGS2144]|uniref:ribonuclease I n=1 Tax=Alkanindiges sp. WGS2144 TaxID=3366808 RepID=UPI0037511D30